MAKFYKKWRQFLTEAWEPGAGHPSNRPPHPRASAYEDLPQDLKSKVDAEKDIYRASYALDPDDPSKHGASAQVWIQDIIDRTGWGPEQATEYYNHNVLSTLEPTLKDEPHWKDSHSHGRSATATGAQSVAAYGPGTYDRQGGKTYMGFPDLPEAGLEAYDVNDSTYQGVFGHEMAHGLDWELGGEFEHPPEARLTKPGYERPASRYASNAMRQLPKFELAFPGFTALQTSDDRTKHWQEAGEPYADIIKLRAKFNKEWQEGKRETPHLTPEDIQRLENQDWYYYGHDKWIGGDLQNLIRNMRKPGLSDQGLADILNTIAVADSPAGPVVTEKLVFDKWRNYLKEDKKVDSDQIAKAVIRDGNKVLILKRSNHLKKHAGEWDLPGGHVIEGEDMQDGLLREVWEETGLRLLRPEKLYSQGRNTYYKAQLPQKKVSLSNEHIDHKLVDIRDLDNYDLPTKYTNAIKRAFK